MAALALLAHNKARQVRVRQEQLHGSAKADLQRTVEIRSDVLLDLKKDKLVQAMIFRASRTVVSTLLSASVIHLSAPDEEDLIEVGRGQLAAARNYCVWISTVAVRLQMIFAT